MVYQQIQGDPITTILRKGLSRDWIGAFAEAISSFHRHRLVNLPTRSPEDEVLCVQALIEQHSLTRGLKRNISNILLHLQDRVPSYSHKTLLHRDLYDQQILINGNGSFCLIDLDDIAFGDPMLDIGNFIAHMHLMKHWQRRPEKLARVRRRFLHDYAGNTGKDTADYVIRERWYEAVALARIAILQARARKTSLSKHLVRDAQKLLNE
jgi:thiamine kinase-like enzyme